MNRKLLKTFATTAHTQLLVQVRQELDLILAEGVTSEEKSNDNALRDDFIVRAKFAPAAEIAEQITYTVFNQLTFLHFIETHGWLVEILPDIQLEDLWYQPDEVQQVIKQLQDTLPEIFTLPILTEEFLTLASQDFFAKLLATMQQNFANLTPETFSQIESLGWIYQYYNAAEKTRLVKLKKPYKKSAVPVVTQIFTPKFIVQYLVDNSLGKFLIENKFLPEDYELQFSIGSFSAKQDVKNPTIEDLRQIKFLDPCCGSGHTLVYAFELFYQAYENLDAKLEEIPIMILQDNLRGLDVDDFAVQIARAALVFTARLHDRNFFAQQNTEQNPNNRKLNIFAVPESNTIGNSIFSIIDDEATRAEALELFDFFDNAKELGSLLALPPNPFVKLTEFSMHNEQIAKTFRPMLNVAKILRETYHVVATNPPYVNTGLMNSYLKRYVTKHFAKTNRDIFACFVRRVQDFARPDGYFALMTPNVWLTASSFTHLRECLLDKSRIITLLSLAPGTFFEEAVVDVVAFVAQNSTPDNLPTIFIKLYEKGELKTAEHEFKNARLDYFLLGQSAKRITIHNPIAKNFYLWPQQIFRQLPDSIIVFSAHEKLLKILERTTPLATYAEPRQGIITGDNDKFLRFWFEVNPATLAVTPEFSTHTTLQDPTWYPHNKGGDYRKWYGNQEYVINWADDGRAIKNHKSGDSKLSRIQNLDYNFRESVGWSAVTSGNFSARYYDETFTFNVAGPSCFAPPSLQKYLLGFLNSCVAAEFTKIINPTMNFNVGDIAKIPFIVDETFRTEVDQLVEQNIAIAKHDYDSCELSWNFAEHSLLVYSTSSKLLSDSYAAWRNECEKSASQLQRNEERLNEIFINIYNLKNILKPQVDLAKISLQIPNAKSAATSFLSFFVGAELGRYSNARPRTSEQRSNADDPVLDQCVNIQPDEILFASTQDVTDRLKNFLVEKYAQETLAVNLRWLADSLNCPAATSAEEFLQEYFVNDFWRNHLATYHDKPIYWQIDSGPERAVRGFFYIHNFSPEILYKKLLAHVTTTQEKFLTELNDLESKKQQTIWPTERRRFDAAQIKIVNKLRELNDFYQKLTTLMAQDFNLDFDTGITKNYAKLSPILTELPPSRYLQKKRALLAQKTD